MATTTSATGAAPPRSTSCPYRGARVDASTGSRLSTAEAESAQECVPQVSSKAARSRGGTVHAAVADPCNVLLLRAGQPLPIKQYGTG